MDGAFKPNNALDVASVLLSVKNIANLLNFEGALYFSSGRSVFKWLPGTAPVEMAMLPGQGHVTSLAINTSGLLAIGRDGEGVYLYGLKDPSAAEHLIAGSDAQSNVKCPTALVFRQDGTLFIANGSATNRASDWKRDLVSNGRSGAVFEYAVRERRLKRLAGDLAYPSGLIFDGEGRLLVSEAWRHRILILPLDGAAAHKHPITDLPGYPGGITLDASGALRVALFAPRSQLFEFVMSEKPYLNRMINETPQENWVCPSLRSGVGYREPLQGGAVRQMGVHKAWAPTLSYGLVVEFDASFNPTRSWHSRADGHAHGVTSVLCVREKMLVAATGDGKLLELSVI